MSIYWEQHLTDIREQLLMMSVLTERNLSQSVRALLDRDDALADLVEAEDGEIDELEKRIDERVISYISTHGPMASDCRFLITASKIASELERIADQATTIARRARDLNKNAPLQSMAGIPVRAGEVQAMLRQSIRAFVERETDLALEVIGRDKLVDAEYKEAAAEVEAAPKFWGLACSDVVLMPSPVTHITGYLYALEMSLSVGMKVVLMERWLANDAIDLIDRHKCSFTIAATTFLVELCAEAESCGTLLPTLRCFASGGAPVPPEVVRRASTVLPGCLIFRVYFCYHNN